MTTKNWSVKDAYQEVLTNGKGVRELVSKYGELSLVLAKLVCGDKEALDTFFCKLDKVSMDELVTEEVEVKEAPEEVVEEQKKEEPKEEKSGLAKETVKKISEFCKANGIELKSTKKAEMVKELEALGYTELVAKEEPEPEPEPEQPKEKTVEAKGPSAKQLFMECKKLGIDVKPKQSVKYYTEKLQEFNEVKEEKPKDAKEDSYKGKSPKELFMLCKKEGIQVKPRQQASVYIKALTDNKKQEQEEEEDWGEEEKPVEQVKPSKPAKTPNRKKSATPSKKPEDTVPDTDDNDEAWDI